MKVSAYWKKALKLPGQDLASFSEEIRMLTNEDKQDLENYSRQEMQAKGLEITE